MIQKCLYCGNPISMYPCKHCGFNLLIPDICPRFKGGQCATTKKLCPNKFDYMNCKVMDKE